MTSENEPTRLSASDVLELPADMTLLDARATEIATSFIAEHVVRLELAAICFWRQHGVISGEDLYELATRSCHIGLQSDASFLEQPVYADGLMVWSNLHKMASGQPVTFEQEPQPEDPDKYYESDNEAYEAWRKRQRQRAIAWFRTVMNDAERLMRSDQLFSFEAADLLPRELSHHVSHDTMTQIFDGLEGTGASLHFFATGSIGRLAGQPESSAYFADALARALEHSIEDLDAASEGEALAIAQHVELWWGLLKGFAYSGAHSKVNCYDFSGVLRQFPEVQERITRVLQNGLDTLHRHDVSTRKVWNGGHYAATVAIAQSHTSQVIDDLNGAVEEAKAAARAWEQMR